MTTITADRLDAFARAWANRDVQGVMSFFTDDCIYCTSTGSEPGTTYSGKDAVLRAVEASLLNMKGEHRPGRSIVQGAHGVSEWTSVVPGPNGAIETRGCDLFEFEGDKIRLKDAFRKAFPA